MKKILGIMVLGLVFAGQGPDTHQIRRTFDDPQISQIRIRYANCSTYFPTFLFFNIIFHKFLLYSLGNKTSGRSAAWQRIWFGTIQARLIEILKSLTHITIIDYFIFLSVSSQVCNRYGKNIKIFTHSVHTIASLSRSRALPKESLSMLLQNLNPCKQSIHFVKIGVSIAL